MFRLDAFYGLQTCNINAAEDETLIDYLTWATFDDAILNVLVCEVRDELWSTLLSIYKTKSITEIEKAILSVTILRADKTFVWRDRINEAPPWPRWAPPIDQFPLIIFDVEDEWKELWVKTLTRFVQLAYHNGLVSWAIPKEANKFIIKEAALGLVGEEDIGKSTFMQMLSPTEVSYTDSLSLHGGFDANKKLEEVSEGCVFGEVAECERELNTKAGLTRAKEVITKKTIKTRGAYKRFAAFKPFPLSILFTSNQPHYIADLKSEADAKLLRKFWFFLVSESKRVSSVLHSNSDYKGRANAESVAFGLKYGMTWLRHILKPVLHLTRGSSSETLELIKYARNVDQKWLTKLTPEDRSRLYSSAEPFVIEGKETEKQAKDDEKVEELGLMIKETLHEAISIGSCVVVTMKDLRAGDLIAYAYKGTKKYKNGEFIKAGDEIIKTSVGYKPEIRHIKQFFYNEMWEERGMPPSGSVCFVSPWDDKE